MDKKVDIKNNNSIGFITMSNPPVNSLSVDLLNDFEGILENIDKDIKVLIFKALGNGFCAGADLKERALMSNSETLEVIDRYNKLFNKIESIECPTIALIHGYALGGGLEFALSCDFRFSTIDSCFGFPETSLGIIPGAGGTQRLTRQIGASNAKKWIFTAKKFDSDETLKDSVVDKIFSNYKDMSDFAQNFALEIARNSQNAVSLSKKAINYALESSLKDGLAFEKEQYLKTLNDPSRLKSLEKFKK